MSKSVKTPCIGVCSTVFGDEVCRGCKRFQHEIIKWNAYDDIQKRSVLNRLELLKVQIMQSKVSITDEGLLRSKLQEYKVKFDGVIPFVGYLIFFDLVVNLSPTLVTLGSIL